MIGNHPFGTFYPAYTANNSNTAQQIKKYSETVAFRKGTVRRALLHRL